jgi:hypothetical protein
MNAAVRPGVRNWPRCDFFVASVDFDTRNRAWSRAESNAVPPDTGDKRIYPRSENSVYSGTPDALTQFFVDKKCNLSRVQFIRRMGGM